MAAGPEVTRSGAQRDVELLRQLAMSLEHVAVLAMLPAQTRLEEIVAPLEERLRLLAGDALTEGMTVGAHGRRLNPCVPNRGMWGLDIIRTANLSVGRQMAARAGESTDFFRLRSGLRLGDLRNIHIWDLERLREMTDVA